MPGSRHDEGDEPVEPVIVAQHDGGLRHAGQLVELRLDLAELDAEAADLNLVVDAAVEDDGALVVEAHRVAGAVEDRRRSRRTGTGWR